jgi:hypothetical protein
VKSILDAGPLTRRIGAFGSDCGKSNSQTVQKKSTVSVRDERWAVSCRHFFSIVQLCGVLRADSRITPAVQG